MKRMRSGPLRSFVPAFAPAFALVLACGSFDAAPADPPADAAAPAEGGGAAPDGGTKFCPQLAAPNTQCWDFDVGDLPNGAAQSGDFAFDTTNYVSPSRSLQTSTRTVEGGEAWARIEHVLGNAPKAIHFEQQVRDLKQPFVQIGQITVNGGSVSYAVDFVTDDGELQSTEATFVNNETAAYQSHPLGTFSADAWNHLAIDLELIDFPGVNAKRRLRITVGDQLKYESTEGMSLAALATPTQTIVRAGVTYVGGSSATQPPRVVTIDDVLVSWAP